MSVFLAAFLLAAVLLWLSSFGYFLALSALALRRRRGAPRLETAPEIAVVIPALNEERLIQAKLQDLRRTDYPSERMTVIVVDGGSRDRTAELVRLEIAAGQPIHLVRLEGGGKSAQINHVLASLTQDIVVVTDVDSRLEPGCVRELVGVLAEDPGTALVGAVVRPESALSEERIYWGLLNRLWWLEGEALSAAVVSGVCYALRRRAVARLPDEVRAEDVHQALSAAARGFRVRICRSAVATEVRVPQTAQDLLMFRRRRGALYLKELLHRSLPSAPFGWRLARAMRLVHFLVAPKVALALFAAAAVLVWTPHRDWALVTVAAFAASLLAALLAADAEDRRPWWKLPRAGARLVALTWISLLTLPRAHSVVTPAVEREAA